MLPQGAHPADILRGAQQAEPHERDFAGRALWMHGEVVMPAVRGVRAAVGRLAGGRFAGGEAGAGPALRAEDSRTQRPEGEARVWRSSGGCRGSLVVGKQRCVV